MFFLLHLQPEPVPKAAEVPEEKPPETKPDSPKKSIDTTNLHKSHLFDLNCKICTGKTVKIKVQLLKSFSCGELNGLHTKIKNIPLGVLLLEKLFCTKKQTNIIKV